MSKDYKDPTKLFELYWVEGMSQKEIGEEFGCSDTTVCKYMNEYNIPSEKKLKDEEKEETVKFFEEGGEQILELIKYYKGLVEGKEKETIACLLETLKGI